jgi:hypothetical protein
MQRTSNFLILAANVFLFSAAQAHPEPRQIHVPGPASGPVSAPGKREGILTDRLSREHQSIWMAIRAVVFAKDKAGLLKRPKLQGLWQQVETSGHALYVEMVSRQEAAGSQAGRFRIEVLDPAGKRHISTIRLNLTIIERATVDPEARRKDGCLPFDGLGKIERYAEVLGHELAHAVSILGNQDSLRQYQDLDREVAEYQNCLAGPNRRVDELELRLNRIRRLLQEFERPAQSAELEIWRELLNRVRVSKIE